MSSCGLCYVYLILSEDPLLEYSSIQMMPQDQDYVFIFWNSAKIGEEDGIDQELRGFWLVSGFFYVADSLQR